MTRSRGAENRGGSGANSSTVALGSRSLRVGRLADGATPISVDKPTSQDKSCPTAGSPTIQEPACYELCEPYSADLQVSKNELQRELRRARAADLVQRVEAAVLAAAAERGAEHPGRLAE